ENGSSQRIHCYIIDTSGNLQSIFNYYTSGYNEILPKLINHTSNKLLLFSSITKQVASLALISRIIARRIDSLGNFIDYFYQGSFADSLYGIEDVIATKDGGFLIATQRYTYSPSFDYQFSYGVFLKLDSAGQKQWIYNPGGYRCNSCDWSYNTIELPCGDFMLSGTFTLYGVPFDTTIPPELNQPARFWHLSRITNQGELVWRRLYNYIKPNNYAYYNYYNFDLDTCPDKGFILSGYISDDINVLDSGWLVKVDSMGCLLPGCHLSPPEVPTDSSVHVLLYPNPANDFINFMPQFFESDVEYRLVDMLGRSVVHGTAPDGSTNMIDSRFLPAGTYLLCVNNDKVRITKKVVVQR
ncbi:MAG: T9SS type A sorting domain-containing protein, partial [Bacteroidetes bacterium]|nr:T9SS type A sorting domain-containing protein [Bacteroidota bacterium]